MMRYFLHFFKKKRTLQTHLVMWTLSLSLASMIVILFVTKFMLSHPYFPWLIFSLILGFGAGSFFISRWMVKGISYSLRQVSKNMNAVSKSMYEKIEPIPSSGLIEIENLGYIFSIMASDIRQSHEKFVRSEKLSMVGKLAGFVGHELRNPLGVIQISLTSLKRKIKDHPDPKVARALLRIEQEVQKSNDLIESILSFSRVKELALSPTNLKEMIERIVAETKIPSTIKTDLNLSDGMPNLLLDRLQMQQTFKNLIHNAIDAMTPQGGTLRIECHKKSFVAVIKVSDTGYGVPREYLPKIFDPLFTTKAHGTGLGLAICKQNIEKHQGRIQVVSQKNHGTRFDIMLPIVEPNKKGQKEHLEKTLAA